MLAGEYPLLDWSIVRKYCRDHCIKVSLCLAALLSTGAFAQITAPGAAKAYPVKPIRLIVPFPAGASSDLVGRMLAQKLTEQMGEQVITDNRAGAGGNLGIAAAAKWIADGGAGSMRFGAWMRPGSDS